MTGSPEILLIDDERTVRAAFRALLEAEGFAVRTARTGAEAIRLISGHRPDLVLLDVMMPGDGGLAVCEKIRACDPLLPILFLTSLDSATTKVRAYEAGGDDYVLKGENADVLVAKIRSVLRRSEAIAQTRAPETRVRLGSLTADLKLFQLVFADGRTEALTKFEGELLKVLCARRGEFVSQDELYSALHGEGFAGDPRSVRFHVHALREKMGEARDLITTDRGRGYRLLG